jgi:curli production assembly/transport component CsgG
MKKLLILIFILLSGCSSVRPLQDVDIRSDSEISKPVVSEFNNIAEPEGQPITIAVYTFTDKTGQRKPSTTLSLFSTAVTQGADAYVVKALQDVGNGKWFRVTERGGLDNLIKERQIIRQMREQFGDKQELPPLLFAGIILEGGIIGYDSNTRTGGAGIRLLGIGPYTQYSQDQVTINMRLVSVQTGEVLASVTIEKNILSTGDGTTVMKFYDTGTKALEIDASQTYNEPIQYATRAAIEKGIVELIKQGETKKLWKFKHKGE